MKSSEQSMLLKALLILCLLAFLMVGVSACATTPQTRRIEVPSVLSDPCKRPDGVEAVKSVADLASYSIRQDSALQICEAKRAGLKAILDATNAPPKRKLWPF